MEVDLPGCVYLKEKKGRWAPPEVLTEDGVRGQAGVRRAWMEKRTLIIDLKTVLSI